MADAPPVPPPQPSLWRRAFGNRTGVGFVGGVVLVATATPRPLWLEIGIAIAAVGAVFRLWASGYLEKNVRVARSGPYRVVRHPLYLGSTIVWAGLLGIAGNPWFAAPAAVAFVAWHVHAIRREERFLVATFGADYTEFRRTVPAFLPTVSLLRIPRGLADGGFSARLAILEHREWHVPLATALFAAGCWWFRGEGQPDAVRWGVAAALGVAVLGRLALFWLLERDIQNPVLQALVAAVSRKRRRERAKRLREQQQAVDNTVDR